ncbi:MAG: hypothetical protein Q9162_005486 [Coniocarpon cinnabarinum]
MTTTAAQVKTDQGPTKSDDAAQNWGYLIRRNKSPSEKLDRLLRGIFVCISKKHPVNECHDLAPTQLAAFYREVGGNYDSLFVDGDPASLALIYRSLGCAHSLQPDPSDDDSCYASPSIPALKPRGFVTWQTIQLLLTPQEHVDFIQRALAKYDVHDPYTKKPFPKILPSSCFPSHPDADMERWHEQVANRLERDAQDATERSGHHEHRHQIVHNPARPISATPGDGPGTPGSERVDSLRHEHRTTSSDDLRPRLVRSFSKAAPPKLKEGGKAVALTVRNIANPFLWSSAQENDHDHGSRSRRRSHDARDAGDSERTNRPRPHRQSSVSTSRPRPRRGRSHDAPKHAGSPTSEERQPPKHRPRRHRSHDPSTNDYFDQAWDARPSSQYKSDFGSDVDPTPGRRKSADHGRHSDRRSGEYNSPRPGRTRAGFSVSEGTRKKSGDTLAPDKDSAYSQRRHRSSVPHAKMPQNSENYNSMRSPPSGRPMEGVRNVTPFKDPFANDYGSKRDARDGRGWRVPPDAASNSSSLSGSSVMSPTGQDAGSVAGSRGGSQPAHRYVTPGQVNGVRGRAYPSGGDLSQRW